MRGRRLIVLALLFAATSAYSQAEWNSVVSFSGEISKKIVSGLSISLQEDIRLNAGKQTFRSSISTLQLDYALVPKWLKIGAIYTYRYQLNDDRYFQHRHRWAAQAALKRNLSLDWNIMFRLRYQSSYREEYYKAYKVNPKNYLRVKCGFEYNIKGSRWAYSAFAEPFVYLNNPLHPFLMDRLRYQFDAEYRLGRYAYLNGFVRLDQAIQVKQPVNTLMVGVVYRYKL